MGLDHLPPLPRSTWLAIAAILVAGLALRIAAATGALWMDEAWSSAFADEIGSPLGIFLSINHDNNHHLNTLWLQLVGLDAPPLVARAFAIATGTAAILAAALIGARRGPTHAWVAALLFALAEAMVTYGSEARGYAPMLLAALASVYLVDRWLEDPAAPLPSRPLAWWTLFGLLSHLTMIFALAALGGWTLIALSRRWPWRDALAANLRLFWPSALVVLAVAGLVIGAAAASPAGFQVGSVTPFTFPAFAIGMSQLVSSTLGAQSQPLWLLPAFLAALLLLVALLRPALLGPRAAFYLIAILGLPLVMAVLQPGNAVILRYYLVGCLALLLLSSEVIARGIDGGGWRRGIAVIALVAIGSLGLARDVKLVANQRGDSSGPVRMLASAQPGGAVVALANSRARAPLAVAAAQLHYPLRMEEGPCPTAPFLFVDRDPGKPQRSRIERCGRTYEARASAATNGLSGGDWTLYARRRLPSAPSPVSDPPPAP